MPGSPPADGMCDGSGNVTSIADDADLPLDDGNTCTDEVCVAGQPSHPVKADSAACDDGDACTQIDTCQSGVCTGGNPVVCDGDKSCVDGACIAPQCPGTVGFPGVPMVPAGFDPSSVAAADLDGDGRPDLAVVNQGSNTVSVLFGKGNGTFAPKVDHATGTYPNAIAVADLDGNGTPDLAIANENDDTLSVLLGKGDGTFAPRVDYPTSYIPGTVVAADVNGDSKLDLVVADFGGAVDVLLGKGDGTFAPRVSYTAGEGLSLAVGDLNGDGKLDVAIAGFGSGAYRVGVLLQTCLP